ncbi:sigma-54 interaction domain-containing protein [Bowmanella dokdonensis]|uniref:Sigma-54-dependent Fis family transcriptional regulator n=1 Tax=Bowmanella dokdonensis TaxID=751969 RepID=A0A939INE6_9ALTE|nr:sigma-54 dependent transcriptional regulator [Bowmanella dokdonensis]MBN7826273.1 sigma-54-dependent Fis family transcriptional regulator [Bowmanella dokdonensis]
MGSTSILLRVLDKSLMNQILKAHQGSEPSCYACPEPRDWVEELLTGEYALAVVELDDLSTEQCQRLCDAPALLQTECIFLSQGKPNPLIDQLMMKSAGFHFRRPFHVEDILECIQDALRELVADRHSPQEVLSSELDQFGLLVGSSKPMRRLYRLIRKLSGVDTNVLVIGESGVGKELVANTLHLASPRSQKPFVAINCGALSPELIDSELFGHVKGAFTGAHKDHMGVFEQAAGGTLFLDEVTEMPLEHQVKLLRVLESGEFRAVGSHRVRFAKARIIAATNREPVQALAENCLREDLYFRLAEFPVHVPPLRERGSDIVGLARHFLAYRNARESQHKSIAQSALDKLVRHSWPGNVRELKHAIERAFLLADGCIEARHLVLEEQLDSPLASGAVPGGMALEDIERMAIFKTLEENGGNKKMAAELLGISVKTLYNKLEKYQKETD